MTQLHQLRLLLLRVNLHTFHLSRALRKFSAECGFCLPTLPSSSPDDIVGVDSGDVGSEGRSDGLEFVAQRGASHLSSISNISWGLLLLPARRESNLRLVGKVLHVKDQRRHQRSLHLKSSLASRKPSEMRVSKRGVSNSSNLAIVGLLLLLGLVGVHGVAVVGHLLATSLVAADRKARLFCSTARVELAIICWSRLFKSSICLEIPTGFLTVGT